MHKVGFIVYPAFFPDLEAEDIKACLHYAAAQADHAVLKVP
jgi:uncharacterized protein (DUF433 family)